MARFKNPATWAWGLGAAFVGGASATIADVGADLILEGSVTLNLQKLGMKALVMGAITAALYLKQSPLPVIEEVEKP